MAKVDVVRALAEPIAAAHGVDIYDVDLAAGKLVVSVTRPEGIDLETITAVSRELNRVLDERDPINGSYTLEVSSPGLERTLRTPGHFLGAVGSEVTVRTKPSVEGERRVKGVIRAADASAVVIESDEGGERTVAYDEIERARTVFTWEPAPKPNANTHSKPRSHKEARS